MNVQDFLRRKREREPSIPASVLAWSMWYPDPEADARKRRPSNRVSCHFPEPQIDEILAEAERQNLTVSQLLKRAWELARDTIRTYPSHPRES